MKKKDERDNVLKYISKNIEFGENTYDIIKMINIIAEERGKIHGRIPSIIDYEFIGKIICVLFLVKPFEYKKAILKLRKRYKGIFSDKGLQEEFRSIITTY